MIPFIQQLLEKQLKFSCFQPLTLLPSILFLFFFYKWLQLRNTSRKNLPPSPPKLPILGNIHQLGTHPHRSLRSMSEKYGDLMMIQLGSVPTLVVSSSSAAREIMVTHDIIFANRPMSKKGETLLYNYKDVVGAPYGEYWRQMKSICVLNLLSNKRVRSFRSVREEETALLVEKLRQAESSPVNLSGMFIEFTNDTICRVAFGRKYTGEQDGINFKEVMKEFNKLLADFNVGDFIPWLAWIDRFNGWDAKVDKIAKKFDQFLEKVVKEHQDSLDDRRKYEDNETDEKVMDFVDVLLDVQKDQTLHSPIDRDSIKALILDMFSAGTDTTSTLLEWAMTELLRHPRAMKELQKEVRGITRHEVGVKEDDLEHMKYLKAVIKETLRLHLPVPLLIPRQSTQDTKIHGYNIPAKTGVIVNGWAIHRNPLHWDEPETFNPERFLNSPTDFRGNDLQFIPFGAGRRMCPGISFAMASSQLVLANLMLKFDWALPDGAEGDKLDMSESFGINMHRNTPLLAVATCNSSQCSCRWLHIKSSPQKNLPPSPPRMPIIGNFHQLGTYPHRSLQSLSERYGELMIIHLGGKPTLIVSSAKAAREIMKTNDIIFSSRPILNTANKLLYNSKDVAAAPYSEYWRQMKSICVLQLLSNKRVRSFRIVREEETAILMEKIGSSASSAVNLSEMFMRLTNNVICRVAFGRKYSDNEGLNFKKLLTEFLELLGAFRVGDFIPWLAWIHRFDGSDAKVEKVVKEFDNFLEQVVNEHQDGQDDSREGKESENDETVKDIVDVLLDVQKEKAAGFTIDNDSIKALILDIFSGGTDTTYTVLEWAMTELLRHPIVMKELQKEVRGITGEKSYVNEDDLEQMKYLKAVIKETLRLHPPIPLLVPRKSTQDTKINGYDIPAGISVITNAWAIQRDPASWDEPENFDPDRFLNSTTDFRGQDFQLIPFGAGRRICPGIMFAMANNELVLANLVHKFNWTLPGGATGKTLDMTECIGLTTHRKIPLLAVATPTIAGN